MQIFSLPTPNTQHPPPTTQLPNGATTAVVQVSSSQETIDLGVVTLATNIFVPKIKVSFIKTVSDINGGLVLPGDVLEYTISFTNSGNDPATRTVVVNAAANLATTKTNGISTLTCKAGC